MSSNFKLYRPETVYSLTCADDASSYPASNLRIQAAGNRWIAEGAATPLDEDFETDNGDFSDESAGTSAVINALGQMVLTCDGSANIATARIAITTVASQVYRLAVDAGAITVAASLEVDIGTSAGASDITSNGAALPDAITYFDFTATGTTTYIDIEKGAASMVAKLNAVSIKPVNSFDLVVEYRGAKTITDVCLMRTNADANTTWQGVIGAFDTTAIDFQRSGGNYADFVLTDGVMNFGTAQTGAFTLTITISHAGDFEAEHLLLSVAIDPDRTTAAERQFAVQSGAASSIETNAPRVETEGAIYVGNMGTKRGWTLPFKALPDDPINNTIKPLMNGQQGSVGCVLHMHPDTDSMFMDNVMFGVFNVGSITHSEASYSTLTIEFSELQFPGAA